MSDDSILSLGNETSDWLCVMSITGRGEMLILLYYSNGKTGQRLSVLTAQADDNYSKLHAIVRLFCLPRETTLGKIKRKKFLFFGIETT